MALKKIQDWDAYADPSYDKEWIDKFKNISDDYEIRNNLKEFLKDAIDYYNKELKGIKAVCDRCNGTGKIVYGNTSTYMNGIGGCAMTPGVCDRCWGSGDLLNKGFDLRKYRQDKSATEKYIQKLEKLLARKIDYEKLI